VEAYNLGLITSCSFAFASTTADLGYITAITKIWATGLPCDAFLSYLLLKQKNILLSSS